MLARYLLAKIHMVAKLYALEYNDMYSYLLAKIHMVAKQFHVITSPIFSYLLAKIHMVAKHSSSVYLPKMQLSSSKNPYGSKTPSCF